MVILPYGIEQPTTGDRGSVFFPILERGLQRLSSHDHDGINSALIDASSIGTATASAPAGSWVLVDSGKYTQNVDLPSGYTFDNSMISIRRSDTLEVVYCKVEKVDADTIKLTAATNTLSYTVVCK